jgi:hypothetical protein
MMDKSLFAQKVAEARARVESMDEHDGFKDRLPGTILAAVYCGINMPESEAIFDAYVMLEDLREMLQPKAVAK